MLTIALAIDFFRYQWNTNQGELWLVLLPQIRADDQPAAVAALSRPDQFTYRALRRTEIADPLEPIPLPTGIDPLLRLTDDKGDVREFVIPRSTGASITKPEDFAGLNRSTVDGVSSDDSKVKPVAAGPFAQSYNTALNDMARSAADAVRSQLQIGLAGGTKRLISPDVADGLGHLMVLANLPDQVIETNLHSLLGLMVRLGTKSDLAWLQSIENVELLFRKVDGSLLSTDLGTTDDDKNNLKTYFSSLTPDLPASQIEAEWADDFSKRVYAHDASTAATPVTLGGSVFHQLTPLAPDGSTLADKDALLNRLEVRPMQDGSSPIPASVISVTFWSTVKCRLAPYRRFAGDPLRQDVLLRLSPENGEEEKFRAALTADPSAFFSALLVDSQGRLVPASALKPVGLYNLPWDNGPTVLFLGSAPQTWGIPGAAPSVLALLPVQRNGLQATAQLLATGLEPTDPFGPRWEATSLPLLHRADFDTLLANPPLPGRTGFGVYFEHDVEFDFAQSAAHIEGLLTVDYPMGAGGVDADNDYLDDLLNHNALNIFERRNGSWLHLNEDGQTYPIYNRGHDSGTPEHVFQPRRQDKVDVRRDGPIADDPRPFLKELYERIGNNRTLSFDLEHRYGTTVDLNLRASLSTHADWPPFLPSDAQLKMPSGESLSFLRISLADPNTAEIHVDQTILDFSEVGSAPRWALNLAAWRSVAEMSQAQNIFLVGEFLRFDFNQGLNTPAPRGAIRGALRQAAGITTTRWEITDALRNMASDWLANPPTSALDPIAVPLADISSVDDLCTCCRFSLEIVRRNGIAPPARRDWEAVRYDRSITNAANQFDEQGLKTLPATDAVERLQTHIKSLKSRAGELPPTREALDDAEVFRRVTGLGEGWIVPDGIIVADPGEVRASVVPMSFRPVARDPALGAKTGLVLVRLFEALQEILEVSPISWAATWNLLVWRSFFDTLQANGGKIAALLGAPVSLIYPLPDPSGLPSDAAAVAASIDKLIADNDPLAVATKNWLQGALLARPALFVDAKGLLINHLRSNVSDALPADLYQLHSAKNVASSLIDEDRITFNEAANVKEGISFVEDIDNARYGNSFIFNSYTLPTFESVIEQLQDAEPNLKKTYTTARATVPLEALVTPTGIDTYADHKKIWLASRAPVQDPVFVRNRVMDEGEREPIEAGNGALFSLDSILNLKPVLATTGVTGARLCARSAPWSQSLHLDDYAALVLYSVTGSEEQTSAADAFKQDEFFVFAEAGDGQSRGKSTVLTTGMSDTFVLDFFDTIQGAGELKSISDLASAIDTRVLDVALSMFKPGDPVSSPDVEGLEPLVIDVAAITIPSVSPVRGAYLFQMEDAMGQAGLGYFLLLAVELPIWDRYSVSLMQTRNRREFEPGSRFSPLFGQASEKVSGNAALAATRNHNLLGREDLKLTNAERSLSIEELVTRLVGAELNPATTAWKDFDLSVLVCHHQIVNAPLAYPTKADGEGLVSRSATPIKNNRFTGGAFGTRSRINFDQNYNDFLVDLQWRSPSNLQFFRLSDCRVTFS
ncbi:hypothetical protein ACC676_01025 [Rhizobium ruizarguesonis]